MSEIRRGVAAIEEAAAKQSSGDFKPFLSKIYLDKDGEERYVLLLNEMEDLPTFDMVGYIPLPDSKFYAEAVAKTDPFFGERSDDFETKWDATIRKTNVAIAVELEPVVEVVNKRRKHRSFVVKTMEYERTILDDDGEATDEKEEVTAPCVGYIAQSPNNFFKPLAYFDANESPVTSTALKITRIGKDTNTSYQFTGYDEIPIDLSALTENIEGVGYLRDQMDDLLDAIDGVEDEDAALIIGKALLDKREEEVIDDDRYQELFDGVTESMDKFGNKKKKGKKAPEKRSRIARRRTQIEPEATDDTGDEPDDPASDPVPTEEITPKARKRSSTKSSPEDRMAELRKKAAAKAAANK